MNAQHVTDVYVFPGLRFSLDSEDEWGVLAGGQFPVAGPQPYDWQPQVSLESLHNKRLSRSE